MKIDFIISSLSRGGAQRVLVILVDNLSKLGYNCRVIVFNESENSYDIESDIKVIKLNKGKIKNHTIREYYELYGFYQNKNDRPDILISFIARLAFVTIPIAKFFRIKIVSCEHSNFKAHSTLRLKIVENVLYRYLNKLTVLTEIDRRHYVIKGINVVKIANPSPFNLEPFTSDKREKNIVAIGSLNRYEFKGFDRLIEMSSIFLKNNNWKLLIIGGGDKGKKVLEQLIQKNQLESKVKLIGLVENVQCYMKTASLLVLPSQHEGLPMVLIEAMAMRLPCVTYDCFTGPNEIIIDGINSELIEDQNEEKFIEAVKKLINNSSIREKYSENTILSWEKFKTSKIINEWDKLLQSI
jgi:glycosyltransferase involved in cell wall biosynthesis